MKDVILYGAGSDLQNILPMIKANGWQPKCIVDSDIRKVGRFVQGIPIVSAKSITDYNSRIIIITASFFDSIHEKIKEVLSDKYKEYTILVSPYVWLMLVNIEYDGNLLASAADFINVHKESILKIYDCNDKITKEILNFVLDARIDKAYRFYEYQKISGLQYVEGYFYENELKYIGMGFTFIDIGAYIGDTYEMMTSMYKDVMVRYYAYEPSTDNYKLLSDRLIGSSEKNIVCKVQCRNCALGRINGMINMGKSGGEFGVVEEPSSVDCEMVKVVRLDDEDISVSGKLVIKMDVEGAEMDVLKGAVQTINKYRPIMAICVYHKYQDIYELPKFIIDMGLNYRFVLRSGIHTHLIAFPN